MIEFGRGHGVPLLMLVERVAKRGTTENGLDELVLAERFGEIVLWRVRTNADFERKQ